MQNTKLILIFGSTLTVLVLKNNAILHSEEHHFTTNEVIDGIMFNPTKIEQLIANFLSKRELNCLSTTIVLQDGIVTQDLNSDLKLDPKIFLLKSYELQFYPHQIVYNLGIKHYQLFQYHLLCTRLSLKLESVTTPLLHLHRLFKISSHRTIPRSITTINALKMVLKKSIEKSELQDSICNPIRNFDSLLTLY